MIYKISKVFFAKLSLDKFGDLWRRKKTLKYLNTSISIYLWTSKKRKAKTIDPWKTIKKNIIFTYQKCIFYMISSNISNTGLINNRIIQNCQKEISRCGYFDCWCYVLLNPFTINRLCLWVVGQVNKFPFFLTVLNLCISIALFEPFSNHLK